MKAVPSNKLVNGYVGHSRNALENSPEKLFKKTLGNSRYKIVTLKWLKVRDGGGVITGGNRAQQGQSYSSCRTTVICPKDGTMDL